MPPRRRSTRLLATLCGLSLLAAACGDDDDSEAGDGAAEDGSGGGAMAAPEFGEASPGCSGEADGVLQIGGLLPETGNLSFLGPPMEAATRLAVNELNAGGGVLGKPVRYAPGDSGDTSTDIANQTVDRHLNEGVDVVLGAASSGVTLTVIDKVADACTILFSPAATTPELTTYDDGDMFFRTAPSDVLQGRVLGDLMLEDGKSTATIMALQDPYGEGLLRYTKAPFEEGGGEVVEEVVYNPQAESFDAEVDEVVSADPDAVAVIGFDESSRIMTSLFEAGIKPDQLYLVDGNIGNATGDDFSQRGALVGVQGTQPAAEVTQDFRKQLLGVDPKLIDFSYAPESYDAVIITALAAELAGTDDPAKVATFVNGVTGKGERCTTFADCKALIDAGTTDIDYDGPSGPQTFSRRGEPTEASFSISTYGPDNRIDNAKTQYRTGQL
ncbi:MAG TPA: ABC transporter substrate-binding protein [Acidimicrobiales bacterium]|nr:ABC transporter substrate-binding protein [Acidimicrobiales bacterium]